MPQSPAFDAFARGLSTDRRIELSREKLSRVLRNTYDVLYQHQSNRIVNYSDRLAKQIGYSLAAHAFRQFQDSMFYMEVIKVLRLWDRADEHTFSIPTVWGLLNCNDVRDYLGSPALMMIPYDAATLWKFMDKLVSQRQSSPTLISLRNHRNKHVAHLLSKSREELRGAPIDPAIYGHERKVLFRTMGCLRLLSRIHGYPDDFSLHLEEGKRQAQALWFGCTFKVLE